MMTLNSLSPAESISLSFLDTSRFNQTPKLPGGFSLRKKRNQGRGFVGKGVKCSVKAQQQQQQQQPPPAWPGRAVPEHPRQSWDGPKPISIVGSTGSIGTQTLDIVAENPDKFRVVALAAGSNVTLLADQVKRFKPALVAVRNESLLNELKEALADLDYKPEIIPGEQGVIEVARHPDAVTVVTGIVGCAGLKPTVAAIEAGKDIALANKETLIAGGPFVLPLANKHNVKILPADSEHSAIFQCIQGLPEGALRKIILTASGGAFRDWPVEKLKEVKVADALKHPNWNMGKKITVDSATLFMTNHQMVRKEKIGLRIACQATSIPADNVPDMEKRKLLNLLLVGALSLPTGFMLVPYATFFAPPGSGGGGGGTPAKDALGNDVVAAEWLKTHGAGDRTLTQGLKGDPTYLVVENDKTLATYGINAVCTHLGCVVPWNKAENKFLCPCHGSQYNAQGRVVRGPAPLSLALAHADIDDSGKVLFVPWVETDFRTGDAPWWS